MYSKKRELAAAVLEFKFIEPARGRGFDRRASPLWVPLWERADGGHSLARQIEQTTRADLLKFNRN